MVDESKDIVPYSVMSAMANSNTAEEAAQHFKTYCESVDEPVIMRLRRR